MTTARATLRAFTGHKVPGLAADIADLFRTLAKALLDPYRPELHYMRGPGPKWYAKHDRAFSGSEMTGMPALVPVRVRR
jgi:hypothetical protein